MSIVAQRDGVRVIAFRKCGHTSIINTFMSTPEDKAPSNSAAGPVVVNSTDKVKALNAYRGMIPAQEDWPEPDIILSFLRNPVTRALSAYQHFFIRNPGFRGMSFRESLLAAGFTEDMSFEDYVAHLETLTLDEDPHIKPQYPDLEAAGGSDYEYVVAPLEMIDVCWPLMMAEFDVNCPMQVLHENRGGYDPESYLTPDLTQRLKVLYSNDYGLWEVIYNETRKTISPVGHQAPF
jgi:hypothetical protein